MSKAILAVCVAILVAVIVLVVVVARRPAIAPAIPTCPYTGAAAELAYLDGSHPECG